MSAGFSISGLVSGIDSNSLVSQLMQVERIPVASMQRQQATYQKGIDAFAGITTRVTALRDSARKLDALRDFDSFITAKSTNAAVTAVASGAAKPGSLSFTVDQLATQHQLFGGAASSFASGSSLVGGTNFTLTVDGTDHALATNGATTLDDLARAINELGVGVNASVVTKTTGDVRLMLTSADTGADAAFTVATDTAAGDFVEVSTAANSIITFGSGASSVQVERSTNTVGDLVDGVTLTLNQTTTSPVTVTTSRDLDSAVEAINGFVTELNSTISQLDASRAYNAETGVGGPLSGSAAVRQVIEGIRRAVSQPVQSLSGTYTYASAVGLEVQRDGSFVLNETKLREALAADFGAVADLFAASASATDSRVSFTNSTSNTQAGTYGVSITQAAKVAGNVPAAFAAGAASFDLTFGGTTYSIPTDATDDSAAKVVAKINAALSTAGISTLLASVDGGSGGISLATTTYGASSSFIVGANDYGITAGTYTGQDVAGTINGLAATGTGRTLRSTDGASNGLSVTVTASQAEVDVTNPLALGDVEFSTGIAGTLNSLLGEYLGTDGVLATAKDSLQGRVDLYQERIDGFERRLVLREATLRRQFSAMETAIASLQSQASFFAAQLNQGQG